MHPTHHGPRAVIYHGPKAVTHHGPKGCMPPMVLRAVCHHGPKGCMPTMVLRVLYAPHGPQGAICASWSSRCCMPPWSSRCCMPTMVLRMVYNLLYMPPS